ncbi:MAG TPA: tRNA (adenosine(37)-N6)-dimethylallyltransferase MiaA [Candidatus Dormibacteraeota bacterium]|nr:tRNA (adenosine(37)-N6)-dimethylallyltransferase MiaA [Candidatus Dormibacteraeota bacterium]HEX2680631.1 tRNA (adenosine(37)-N6)-dimethylallyltransferase MiaA [Candidatus Dormibacteraeota bacterium]
MAGTDAALSPQLLKTVPVIVGPTGIGKSRIAFELSRELGGEIVVADSRQVYQLLDIATNKPSPEARRAVAYHMIDFVDPRETFNAAQYVAGARAAIESIPAPVVEGGTMLYVDALCDGFTLTGIPPNPALRAELETLGVDAIRERLLALDPDPGVDLHNPVRMIRAIEILEVAGPPLRGLRARKPPPWTPLRIGLTASLVTIDRRLEERSRQQVERGLVAETQMALDAGVPQTAPVLTGIGYAEALAHIRGELTSDELPVAMARSNRRYARRQLRWWRKDDRVNWFEIEPDPVPGILTYVRSRLG